MRAFLGIDVGTSSARAGVFDERGHLLGRASEPIEIYRPAEDFVEQSSEDIWRAAPPRHDAAAFPRKPPGSDRASRGPRARRVAARSLVWSHRAHYAPPRCKGMPLPG